MNMARNFLKYPTGLCLISMAVLVVAGCGHSGSSSSDDGLSNKEIMVGKVDQNADLLWESVSSTSDATGVHVKKPESAEDWRKLEEAAAEIASAMDLLLDRQRPLVPKGMEVADADKPGALNAQAIKALIDADRPGFEAHAMQLKAVAEKMRNAVQSHDSTALMELGGDLDDVCEECHKQFWYPSK